MYDASAVLHKEKVYVAAGTTPHGEAYHYIFSYNIKTDEWSRFPSNGHIQGTLQIINDQLTVIGGSVIATKKATNKVSTFDVITNDWKDGYPNLMKPRAKPGVVTHDVHVIVLGGTDDNDVHTDSIEVSNWSQPLQWVKSNIKLPDPMWRPSVTILHDQLYIVGYSTSRGRYSTACRLPINPIISSIYQSSISSQSVSWNLLPNAPHHETALLPRSYPPVIIGGHDVLHNYVPTSDIAMYDAIKKTWKRVASLSTARSSVAIVPISHESVLIIGGTKGGKGIQANRASCVSTVEKGRVSVSNKVTRLPKPVTTCIIQ